MLNTPNTERRSPGAVSTYEAGYYYASSDVTPTPGSVPAEEVLLTLTGTWSGNLANCMERMLSELDDVTADEYSFRRESGVRYRAEADTLDELASTNAQRGHDLAVGESYAITLRQDIADGDTEMIVMYVLRTA